MLTRLSDTPLGKLLGLERKGAALVGRALALWRRNPWILQSVVREGYRNLIGLPLDLRRHPGKSGLPIEITLDLTRRCNLRCVMCTQQIRHSADIPREMSWYDPDRELPLEAWVNLLDQVKSFRPRLHVTGGEPLIYPAFRQLVQEIKQQRFMMRLTTNGTLLPQVADLLVSLGVEAVAVSLDGPPEIHDRIRGQKNTFRRAAAGIEALAAARRRHKRHGPILVTICTISKANLATLGQMVPIALDLGADILQIHHTFFNSPANIAKHNLLLSPAQARKWDLDPLAPIFDNEYYQSEIGPMDLPLLLESLREVKRQARGRLNLVFVPNLPLELVGPYYLDLDYPFPSICKHLWKSCRIYPDGTITPCFHIFVGNITTQPFQELWNHPRMQRFRELIARRGLLPGCARCCSRRFT